MQAKADKPKNKNLPSKQKIKASSAGCFLSPKPREKSFPQVLLTRAPGKMQRATIASVKYRAFLSHVFCDALNCRLRGGRGDQIQSGEKHLHEKSALWGPRKQLPEDLASSGDSAAIWKYEWVPHLRQSSNIGEWGTHTFCWKVVVLRLGSWISTDILSCRLKEGLIIFGSWKGS